MNVYEVELNGTFFWIAAETAFDAMNHLLDVRDAYENDQKNSISAELIDVESYDDVVFTWNEGDSEQQKETTLLKIMAGYENRDDVKYPYVIATESDE